MGSIRVVALAVVRRPADRALLVSESTDRGDGLTFQRPLGGTVEFGELASAAVERELMEEVGFEFRVQRSLGVMENRFEFEGASGHEIVFLFEGRFSDPKVYELEHLPRVEEPPAEIVTRWRSVDAVEPLLVPRGIEEYL